MSAVLRTRFAPSPTGDLHLGGAWTALASWRLARAAGGATVLRMEDVDTPRIVHGSAARIAEDLAWLGLDWDEGPFPSGRGDLERGTTHAPYTQSERAGIYDRALAELTSAGLVYPCDCSRAEISRVASAPHAGEELVYPGTCRDAPKDRAMRRPPALRLRVPGGATVAFEDLVRGPAEQRVDVSVGDFVLRRGDGIYAYQLVVAVDDAAMRISHVVRADDLLSSTARQILLMRLLGTAESHIPAYAHVPMVVTHDGDRLAKRVGSVTIRELRARGITAEEITRELGRGLGLVTGEEPPSSWRKEPWPIPAAWA
jgi:glutamyl-tRNA synthetase